jgi:hypothetical protein
MYSIAADDSDLSSAQISVRARDIVWMLACACTASESAVADEPNLSAHAIGGETLVASLSLVLKALGRAPGSSSSRGSVADGVRLATIRAFRHLDGAELGEFDIGARLYKLLVDSAAKEDMLAYVLDGQWIRASR